MMNCHSYCFLSWEGENYVLLLVALGFVGRCNTHQEKVGYEGLISHVRMKHSL